MNKKCNEEKNLTNFSKNNKIVEEIITNHNNKVKEYISKHPVPN